MATKHANKIFLSWLKGFFPHFSLRVEGRLWVGCVVSFDEFNHFLLLVVGGARNELGHEIDIYYDRAYQPRSTHKLHRLITNQPILHHDERIGKRISTTYDQYMDPRFLHPVYLKYW
jgi:hypothetical protein